MSTLDVVFVVFIAALGLYGLFLNLMLAGHLRPGSGKHFFTYVWLINKSHLDEHGGALRKKYIAVLIAGSVSIILYLTMVRILR